MENKIGIEYVPLELIQGSVGNPKDHDIAAICASFERFGFVAPIVLDQRTLQVCAGHGRLEALRSLQAQGQPPPKNIRQENGQWLAPVVTGWASKNDAEAEAYRIADNRLTEIGGWLESDLIASLERIKQETNSFAGIGYTIDELNEITAKLAKHRVSFDALVGDTPFKGVQSKFQFVINVSTIEQRDTFRTWLDQNGFEYTIRVTNDKVGKNGSN